MNPQHLLIVFVKNPILGKVKTRLAKTVGDESALEIYQKLLEITERETRKVNAVRHIYFSEMIISSKWKDDKKYIQEGTDLGARMLRAFLHGFLQGYKHIIIVGSDLPDITKETIETGFEQLKTNDIVFVNMFFLKKCFLFLRAQTKQQYDTMLRQKQKEEKDRHFQVLMKGRAGE